MAILNNDFNALQTRIKNILGVGAGDSGYGQTLKSSQLSPSALILTANFQSLIDDIRAARYHQIGVPVTPLIPDAPISMTLTIWNKMLSVMTDVEKNKLAIPPISQATRTILSSEATTNDTWNSTTTHIVTVQFSDANHMRYYFNSGGTIEFSATSTNTSSNLKSNAWNSLLKSVGVVSFKQSVTTSTKSTGTKIGFSSLTTSDKIIFTKSITDTPAPNRYTITANKDDETASVSFTITFTNAGANVTSVLHSTVNAYRATGINVEVAEPDAASELIPGLANPTFALSRSVNKTDEGGVAVTFTMTTTNFSDSVMYWSIIGSKITAADFDPPELTGSFEVLSNTGTFDIYAAADNLTEGSEQFNVQIRTDSNPNSPIVAQLSSLEIIADLSTTPPAPSYTFLPLTTTSVSEGQSVIYRVVTTNVPDGTVLKWSTISTSPVSATDFVDNRLTGTITIYGNNAEFVRSIATDILTEKVESYQIVLSYVNPVTGVSKNVQTSELVKISDPAVEAPTIPYTVTTDVYSIPEDSTSAVRFIVRTPPLLPNTRLYWRAVTDTGLITASDFSDNTLTGSVIISQSTGIITRKAKKDTFTEGDESFHLSFYLDSLMTQWLVDSDIVSISESVPYVLLRTPASMGEGSLAGVTFTLTTPKLPDGTILYWTTISEAGTLVAADFTDNIISGTVTIVNNTGTILRRATSDNLTEGTEQFHLEIRAVDGNSGPVLVSSQSTTVTEIVKYEIVPQVASIFENQIGVEFIIKTPYLKDGTVLYWDTLTSSGAVTATDFTDNRLSGTVTINGNTGSITRTAIQDNLTEGNESFYLILKTGTALGTKVAESAPVVISEIVAYTIVPTVTSFIEGQSGITINITTPYMANGSKLYWTILRHAGNITADDFIVSDAQGGSAQRLNGYVVVNKNKASFIISGRSDGITEGVESFQIELRLDSINGPIQATTDVIMLAELISYRVVPNVTSINEGGSVTFTVTTPYVLDGTVLYWTTYSSTGVMDSSDFTDAIQSTITINSNSGTIIRTLSADKTTEGTESFSIELRSGSYAGPVLVTSGSVTINDTSGTPAEVILDAPTYSIIPNKTSVIEGDTVTFTIATTNVLPATSLYWTLFKGPGLTDASLVPSSSPSAIHIAYDNPGTASTAGHVPSGVTITVSANSNSQADRAFIFELRTGSTLGTVIATSSVAVRVVDPTPYMVYAEPKTIVEGSSTGVTFTVTTPEVAYGTNLTWTVVSEGSSTVDVYDLSPGVSGLVAINSSGTGTFTLTALANSPVEGNEKFHINLSSNGSPISLGSTSPSITIVENTPYLLSASPLSVNEGSLVTFTFSTPKMTSDTTYTWQVNSTHTSFNISDVIQGSGGGNFTIPSSATSQTFTVSTAADSITEGTETFYLDIRLTSTGQPIVLGAPSPVITITEVVGYTISADKYSIIEGNGVINFTVTTPMLLTPPIVSIIGAPGEDFFEKTATPVIQGFTGTSGTFVLTPVVTNPSKGERTFTVKLDVPANTTSLPITIKAPVAPPIVTPPGSAPPTGVTWELKSGGLRWPMRNSLPFHWSLVTNTSTTSDRTIVWTAKPLVTLTPAGERVKQGPLLSGTAILPGYQKYVNINIPSESLPIPKENPSDPFTVGYSYGLTLTVNGAPLNIPGDVAYTFLYELRKVSVVIDPYKLPYNASTNKTKVTVTVPWYWTKETATLRAEESAFWSSTAAPFTVPAKISVGTPPELTFGVSFDGTEKQHKVDYKDRIGTGFIETVPSVPAGTALGQDIFVKAYIDQDLTIKYSDNYSDGVNKFSLFASDYSISASVSSVDETPPNNVVTFTVNVPSVDVNAGKTLYWKLNGLDAAAFSLTPVVSKSVTSTATTFEFIVKADNEDNNGPKQFFLTASFTAGGTAIATSPTVTVNDTSRGTSSTLTIDGYLNQDNTGVRTGVTMPISSSAQTDYTNGYLKIPVTLSPSAANHSIKVDIISTIAGQIAASFNMLGTTKVLPTDSDSKIYFVMSPVFRSDITKSEKFQVRFTSQTTPTVTITSKELDFIVQGFPTPPTFNQTVTLAPVNILTTAKTTLTITGGDANTAYSLSITSGPRPTDGPLNANALTYSGNLNNGGATVELGPWNGAGNVKVNASFANGTTKQSNEITITSPAAPPVTITVPAQTLSVIADGISSVTPYCRIDNLSIDSPVTVQVVDASSPTIYEALGLPSTGAAGTVNSYVIDGTYRTATKRFTVTNLPGLTAGTFKVKFSVTDPNGVVKTATSDFTINVTVPTVYTPTITVTANDLAGLTIVLAGGRPGSSYSISLGNVTGSLIADSNVSAGNLSLNGGTTISYHVPTTSTGVYLNLGMGTGELRATFENNVVKTKTISMRTIYIETTGPVTGLPSNTYITMVAIGGGGGSGGGLDASDWNGSSAGGGGAGGTSRQTSYVTTQSYSFSVTIGAGGTAGASTPVVLGTETYSGYSVRRVGDGGNGGDTLIAMSGVTQITSAGGKGSVSGEGRRSSGGGALTSFTMPGGVGGYGSYAAGGAGGNGSSDPRSGASTCPAAEGGSNGTLYGKGAASSSVYESASQGSWATYAGNAGGNGVASFTWFII